VRTTLLDQPSRNVSRQSQSNEVNVVIDGPSIVESQLSKLW
jgi:hypothetical protein